MVSSNESTQAIAEYFPGLYEEFKAQYAHPTFEDNNCSRCGVPVKKKYQKLHKWWHFDLNLRIYADGVMLAKCLSLLMEIAEEENVAGPEQTS